MSDEEGFLNAIQHNPNDDAIRLIYADWLEERGDPNNDSRSQYLRLEHQFAQLKHPLEQLRHQLEQLPPRFAQLREQIDQTWLAVVGKKYKLVLVAYELRRKIHVIKLVREVTVLGLGEAKNLVEATRSTIKDDLTLEDAVQMAARFLGIATVAIEAHVGK